MNDQVEMIEITQLEGNEAQTRSALRNPAIAEYSQRIREAEKLDPALVFQDGERLILAAGFHRREAYRRAGHSTMPCIVRSGTLWDAIEAGLTDNQKHVGERLTTADKRHNIGLVLREKPGLSNCQVAELVGVTDKTVAKVRGELERCSEIPSNVVRTGSDGRKFSVPIKTDPYTWDPFWRPLNTDTEHCPCGGTWVSDGHGQRYCEECNATHPWDEYPLPELEPGLMYGAFGTNHDLALLEPLPDIAGCFYVAHFRNVPGVQPEVVCHMRGVPNFPGRIKGVLNRFGFMPTSLWKAKPSSGERPDYIPSEEQRWEIERVSRQHFEQTGKWPREARASDNSD